MSTNYSQASIMAESHYSDVDSSSIGMAMTRDPFAGGRSDNTMEERVPNLERDDPLRDWAPTAPPLERLPPSQAESYLPASSSLSIFGGKSQYKPTSKPINLPLSPLQESMSYSLARLLSLPRFAAFLSTPLGFNQFKAYISEHGDSTLVTQLEMWHDLNVLSALSSQVAYAAKGVSEVYADEVQNLPKTLGRDLVHSMKDLVEGRNSGLDGPAKHLLDSLYASEFESFMKSRLCKHTTAQLAHYNLSVEDRTGIGEAYVLVNPRLQDRPIVLVSPGFELLTGYRSQQIIGRNCRFLQGKATSPDAVKAIKHAVDTGSDITQLVLNYTSDCRPFMNLLTMIALRDVQGRLTYFIGGQTDITSVITGDGVLSLNRTGDSLLDTDMTQFSPGVRLEARESATASPQTNSPVITLHSPPSTPTPVQMSFLPPPPSPEPPTVDKFKAFCHKLFAKKHKQKAETFVDEPRIPLTLPPKKEPQLLETIADEYASTYSKLLVVKRETREILFATSGFLRFVGLPGKSRHDVNASPLVHLDFLNLIISPQSDTPQANREVQYQVKKALEDGLQSSLVCGIRYKDLHTNKFFPPSVSGRLYISPLHDMYGESAASAVVFA